MNDARKERLLREVLGPNNTEVPLPERTIAIIAAIAFALLVVIAATPTQDARDAVAISAIEARAATIVNVAPSVPAASPAVEPKDPPADGNVVDLTF
jgi:hypothetical protein